MLSLYVPVVSTGTSSNPRACVGDSLYEWVINNNATQNTLSRIRKDTYYITNTVSLPNINCTHITLGNYQGTNYIFTSSGTPTGNIYRVISTQDNPAATLTSISITNTDLNLNVSSYAITYKNGYLWILPSTVTGISKTVLRLNIFNNLNKTNYSYTSSTTDPQLTVYNGLDYIYSTYTLSTIYVFKNYVFVLTVASSQTFITKLITTPGTSGIFTPENCSFRYYSMAINALASDDTNYIWMSESSGTTQPSSRIYRLSVDTNLSLSQSIPTATGSFYSTLTNISTMKYGAGYLWITGTTTSGTITPALVQVDVTNNTIINTIPLITSASPGVINPTSSYITGIDIYSEYMWMTDSANSALLKMKIYIPCFMEGTKILCLNSQMKQEYIPIENIRKGHLVKTLLNGFVPVCMIGKSSISNPGVNDRIKNRLYKCARDKYPELFEDLYLTGCHSILVDELSDSDREKTLNALGDIFVTDDKFRLMAYLDERSEPYTEPGTYTIWHLALENNDYLMNYGIYANGLLVESTSKRYMKELSGMELIE